MTSHYVAPITLTLLGPFLTAGTGATAYGLDKSFHRDHQGKLAIPASHIKGKIRMALEELDPLFKQIERPDLVDWFGSRSDQDNFNYAPSSGMLRFSDFSIDATAQAATRTRVTMHQQAMTATENLLREVEDAFASGCKIRCTGTVSFYAQSNHEAQKIVKTLEVGLRWLSNLGGEKSVGYGRVYAVRVDAPKLKGIEPVLNPARAQETSFHLRIAPHEPIHIGGIKSGRTNYSQSRQVISGGVIKGALAEAINRAHGVRPVHKALSKTNSTQYPEFSMLAEHFHAIRVTQALPVHVGKPRPVHIPISTVKHGSDLQDTALSTDRFPIADDKAPFYFIDWKSGDVYWGKANPKEIFVTRAEVDNVTQRSSNGQLFTYSFLCPTDEAGTPIEWVCNVDFAAIGDGIADDSARESVISTVRQQFAKALTLYLHHLGKLKRAVEFKVHEGQAEPAMVSKAVVQDHLALVTLQSNAILLNPEQVRELAPHQDLQELYAAYWHEISQGSLALEDFFANQSFEGGYLYHRFLGTAKRNSKRNQYQPYYLTQAGSLFRLRATDEAAAQTLLAGWLAKGLPLPAWAKTEYEQPGRALWENCPFVPENGFGEIIVNLAHHWEKRL